MLSTLALCARLRPGAPLLVLCACLCISNIRMGSADGLVSTVRVVRIAALTVAATNVRPASPCYAAIAPTHWIYLSATAAPLLLPVHRLFILQCSCICCLPGSCVPTVVPCPKNPECCRGRTRPHHTSPPHLFEHAHSLLAHYPQSTSSLFPSSESTLRASWFST